MKKKNELAQVVGENIARRRKLKGLTQEQLAELLDINQESLSRMENGTITPRLSRIKDFAAALGCAEADFFRSPLGELEEYVAQLAEILRPFPQATRKNMVEILQNIASTLGNSTKT